MEHSSDDAGAKSTSTSALGGEYRDTEPRKRKSLWMTLLKLTGLAFGLGTIATIGLVIAAMVYFNNLSKEVPDHASLADYKPMIMTRVYAGDGSLVAEYAREFRLFVPIESMPDLLKNAFISAEDQNFYEHDGLDYRAIVRGMIIQNAINKVLGKKKRLIGASTITQQVAKNFLLESDVEIERKMKEWIIARRMEQTLSKDDILELYLNKIYLGNRAHGVARASLNYFNKPLNELSVAEVAYLAAIPKGPSNYHPVRNKDAATERRDWVIGRMFEDGHISQAEHDDALKTPLIAQTAPPSGAREWATEYFAEQVRKEVTALYDSETLYDQGLAVRTTLDPFLQRTAGVALRRWLIDYDMRHGWRGVLASIDLDSGEEGQTWQDHFEVEAKVLSDSRVIGDDLSPWRPAVVLSASDSGAQIGFGDGTTGNIPMDGIAWAKKYISVNDQGEEPNSVREILKRGDIIFADPLVRVPEGEEAPGGGPGLSTFKGEVIEGDYMLRQIPAINGGFTAIDPHTGRVLAMVGGFSFQLSEFNRAIQALRQPGSTFKPFIYALALDSGYSPSSLVLDAPFVAPTVGDKWWRPGNYIEGSFGGPSTLRKGIEKSRNTMTARLAQDLGIQRIVDYIVRFNLSERVPRELAISLGSAETTLMRMTAAYAVFVNGGKAIEPLLIDRIQDRDGKTIYLRDQRICENCSDIEWTGQSEPALNDPREQILDPRTAYQMVSILEGVVRRGTGSAIRRVVDKPTAGKTGTTNDYKDAWFVGFSPDLAAGAYVGFDLPRSLGVREAGGKVAAPIFADFMKAALAEQTGIPFRVPAGVRLVRVNSDTGQPAGFGDTNVVLEAFKASDRIGDNRVLDGSFDDIDPLSAAPSSRAPGNDELEDLGGIY